jgi:general secretion pathway protein K
MILRQTEQLGTEPTAPHWSHQFGLRSGPSSDQKRRKFGQNPVKLCYIGKRLRQRAGSSVNLPHEKPREVSPNTANSCDAGFILIPVLATLGLLTLIAMVLAKTTIVDVRTAAYQVREAELEALADGAARLAIRRIVSDRTAARSSDQIGTGKKSAALPINGRPVICSLPGATAIITVQDVGGLIDLNTAPQVLFERLLISLDLTKETAAKLAAAIIDFRDLDDSPLPGGAETAEYRAAGIPFGPKNGPFVSVNELDQVLGMTPTLLARLRTMVTVHSASRGVDLSVASGELRGLGLESEFVVPSTGRAFQLQVTAANTQQTSFTRDVVFEPNLRAPAGFVISSWRRNLSRGSSVGTDHPPCSDLARAE